MADALKFDCFLSHNQRDKPAVRKLAAGLVGRGVSVWLDEEQLRPGLSAQRQMDAGIRQSRSVAVLVGADGLGPWEQEEVESALRLAVGDGRPVIPVLLPDAPGSPGLPGFLATRTWVDLRAAVGGDGLSGIDRLVWGITGRRPSPDSPSAGSAAPSPAPPMDEVSHRVSDLRRALLLAPSLDELQLLKHRVRELQARFGAHHEVSQLADVLERTIAAMSPPRPSPAYRWPRAGAWAAGLIAVGVALWSWLHRPEPAPWLVNRPAPGWVADWSGALAGLDGGAAAPVGVRLRIGADHSHLELQRRDQVTCVTPVAVEVEGEGEEQRARVWSPGPIPCPDGRVLGELALTCQAADAGGADCAGLYVTGRPPVEHPIHLALARVGGGDWPAPAAEPAPAAVPAAPPEPAGPAASAPSAPAGPGASAEPAATPAGTDSRAAPVRGGPAPGPSVIVHPLKDGGQAPEMIPLPAGCFMMGSPPDEPERDDDEGPPHRVCVAAFAIGRTEVTFAQYDRFAAATGRKQPNDAGWGRGERPVINVSWDDAVAYTEWLSAQTGQPYRLPSEAEWEYAARAGTTGPFWTGDCIHTDQANYDGNSDYAGCGARTGAYRGRTVPAGSLPPNPWGLHEVAGNVWEWVLDRYHPNYQGAPTDGSAWLAGGSPRALRGGSLEDGAGNLRASNRYGDEPGDRFRGIGFRCVLAAPRQPVPSTH